MITSKRLKISLVGMSPAIVQKGVRLKGIPLAPLALKAYVTSRIGKESLDSIDIQTRTFFVEEETVAEITSKILADKPDVVAFSVYIWNYREAMECARILKETDEKIFIICGGPQVSPIATEIMEEHSYLDAVTYIQTPGEVVFYQFVRALIEKRNFDAVDGIIYRKPDGSLVKTSALTEDIDYSTAASPYLNGQLSLDPGDAYTVVLEGFRGCPMDCGYCLWGCGIKKINYFPLDRLLREIEVVYRNPNIRQVIHSDSDMLLNRQRTEVIIKHIIKQDSLAESNFNVNILNLNENIAKLLAKLPKYHFCFGIQTTNPKALEHISRFRPDIEIFREKFRAFRQWVPNADFFIDIMLGLPGDDLEGFKTTLEACLSFEPTRLRTFYPVFLLPGTRFFEQRKELGIRHGQTAPFCVIETEDFPKQDIEKSFWLAFWTEVFTYYFPAIAKFFYEVCTGQPEEGRIDRIEKWIAAIEERLDIFGSYSSIVDVATSGSVQEWNKLRGQLLKGVSETKGAYQIYRAIYEQENNIHPGYIDTTIKLGIDVFDYMHLHKIDSVDFKNFNQLPSALTRGIHIDEVKNLFSRYAR